ncbi:hypothetical protein [Flavobacterium sp.]|jgi:hypothetical protein
MKNKLFTFFLLVFFVGCSTNNDSNGNSTTTDLPVGTISNSFTNLGNNGY